MTTRMTPDEYARAIGLKDEANAWPVLYDAESCALTAISRLETIERIASRTGYIRRSCLALALLATRGLLRTIRFDLEEMGKR